MQDAFKADLSAQIPGIVNQERLDWIGFVLTVKGGEAGVTGREKVIKGLECCAAWDTDAPCSDCPYDYPGEGGEGPCLREKLIPDVLELLKLQEMDISALKNAYDDLVQRGSVIVRCRDCKYGTIVMENGVLPFISCDGVEHDMDWFCAAGVRAENARSSCSEIPNS